MSSFYIMGHGLLNLISSTKLYPMNCPTCNKEYKRVGKFYDEHVAKCTGTKASTVKTSPKSSGTSSPKEGEINCHKFITNSEIVWLQMTLLVCSNKDVSHATLLPQKPKFNQVLLDIVAILPSITHKGVRKDILKILQKIENIKDLGITLPTD
jgi:hypothetical protein